MPNDLQSVIRAALRSGDITESGLRRPILLDGPPRRAGTRPAVAAVVLAVAVLAGVLALVLPRDDGRVPAGGSAGPTGPTGPAGFVGYGWRVVRIQDSQGTHAVPAGLHARVGYTRDGYVLGDDDLNALQGRYVATPSGYTVRDAASTAVGGAGGVTLRSRVSAATDAMFFSVDGRSSVTVGSTLVGDTLTLHSATFTITLRKAGAQPDFRSDLTSPTPTRTG